MISADSATACCHILSSILQMFSLIKQFAEGGICNNSMFHEDHGIHLLSNMFDYHWMVVPDFIESTLIMVYLIGALEYFSAQVPYFMMG